MKMQKLVSRAIKFIARLRRQQPALIILPSLILGQVLSSCLGIGLVFFMLIVSVYAIYRQSAFSAILAGLAIGLISTLSISSGSMLNLQESVIAELADLRRPKHGLVSIRVEVLSSSSSALIKKSFMCRAVNLPWKNVSSVEPGDRVILKANFRLFEDKLWPWEYAAGLKRRGVDGECRLLYLAKLQHAGNNFLQFQKKEIISSFKALAGDDEISALMLSLSLGLRDQLSLNTERVFKDFGISHVLVLSGMQIGLLYFFIYSLARISLRFMYVPVEIRKIACLSIAGIISLGLVAITNFEASALRAWIACLLFSLADLDERKTELFRGSLASLLVLCIFWPGCWAEAGIQLSFAAIFGIAFGQNLAEGKMQKLLLPCLLATVFSSAVAALWFSELSIMAIASNFILTPLFGVLGCYLGIFAIMAGFLPDSYALFVIIVTKFVMQQLFNLCLYLHAAVPEVIALGSYGFVLFATVLLILLFLCVHKQSSIWIKQYNLFTVR